MNFSRLEWVTSFIGCSISHQVFKSYKLSDNISNVYSCIIFQLFFVYNTGYLVHSEIVYGTNDQVESSKNLSYLYGYFIYDLLHLVYEDNWNRNKTYILHHIVSCMMIDITLDLELKNTFYQNAFVFVAEFTSPIINNRILVRNNPTLKQINKTTMKYSYFICRVIAFPLLATGFLYTSEIDFYTKSLLGSCFTGVYLATLNWFKKILN
jgi:hypothetical protein